MTSRGGEKVLYGDSTAVDDWHLDMKAPEEIGVDEIGG